MPDHWRGLLNLAVAQVGLKKTSEAQKNLRRALQGLRSALLPESSGSALCMFIFCSASHHTKYCALVLSDMEVSCLRLLQCQFSFPCTMH